MLLILLKKSGNLILSAIITTVIFVLFNIGVVKTGLMSFDPSTFGGFTIGGLPYESIVYNLIYVFLGLGLYKYLNYRFPDNSLDKFSLTISNLMLGVCFALGFFGREKVLTMTILVLVFLTLLGIEYLNKVRFMYRFYRAFAALIIPFGFVIYILTNKKGAKFNETELLGIKIGPVPIEHFFYAFLLLLVAVFILEKLNHRARA